MQQNFNTFSVIFTELVKRKHFFQYICSKHLRMQAYLYKPPNGHMHEH